MGDCITESLANVTCEEYDWSDRFDAETLMDQRSSLDTEIYERIARIIKSTIKCDLCDSHVHVTEGLDGLLVAYCNEHDCIRGLVWEESE